jgi:hypothetical protein
MEGHRGFPSIQLSPVPNVSQAVHLTCELLHCGFGQYLGSNKQHTSRSVSLLQWKQVSCKAAQAGQITTTAQFHNPFVTRPGR